MNLYTNGEIIIAWDPMKCDHEGRCGIELPAVFRPGEIPRVRPEGASTERLIQQIKRCTPGALTYQWIRGVNPKKKQGQP